jgi:hypothetical protein
MREIQFGEYMSGKENVVYETKMTCVECGKTSTKAQGHGHDKPPEKNDATVCCACGCIMQFGEGGMVKAPPEIVAQVKKQLGLGALMKFFAATGKEMH